MRSGLSTLTKDFPPKVLDGVGHRVDRHANVLCMSPQALVWVGLDGGPDVLEVEGWFLPAAWLPLHALLPADLEHGHVGHPQLAGDLCWCLPGVEKRADLDAGVTLHGHFL